MVTSSGIYLNNAWHNVQFKTLALQGPPQHSAGLDPHLGAYTTTSCEWRTDSSGDGGGAKNTPLAPPNFPAPPSSSVPITTSVTAYTRSSSVLFNVAFPQGAAGTNVSSPVSVPWGKYGPSTAGVVPFAEWPTFNLSTSGAAAANSSFMTWNGGLQYHDEAAGTVRGGTGFYDTYLGNMSGLSFGPVVLFNEAAAAAAPAPAASPFPTAVVSPASNINTAAMRVQHDRFAGDGNGCSHGSKGGACLWSHGPSGELLSVPAGYNHSTLITFGAR